MIPSREREREIRELPQKIPKVLCDKFGDAPTRDFKTFEREFREMYEFYSVPESQKLPRLKAHLGGSVLVHANIWIDAQEDQIYTYQGLVEELIHSFQTSVR